jgi:uncharacterized protein YqgC (DUF456 family)
VHLTDLLWALLVAVGLVGIVLPVLPGTALVWSGVLGWAVTTGTTAGWSVLAGVTVLLGVGAVAKYALPGRRLTAAGVPRSTLVTGGLLGVVGFFVVPVVGLPLGFVLGVHAAEVRRVGPAAARGSTRAALGAAGLSLVVELGAGLLAASTWLVAAVLL